MTRKGEASNPPMKVSVHPGVFIFLLYAAFTGQLATALISFVSILLHEGAHALAACLSGWRPVRLVLTPLGALLEISDEERMKVLPRLMMLLAGPLMSLLICWAAFTHTRAGVMERAFGRRLFLCNLLYVFLNLLPVLPLDGGRILTLVLKGARCSERVVTRIVRGLGYAVGCLFVLFNIAMSFHDGQLNLSLAFVGCFLIYAAQTSPSNQILRDLEMLDSRKNQFRTPGPRTARLILVTLETPLRFAVLSLPERRSGVFVLQGKAKDGTLLFYTEEQVIAQYLRTPGDLCAILCEKGAQPPTIP